MRGLSVVLGIVVVSAVLWSAQSVAMDCGSAQSACQVSSGSYHVALPMAHQTNADKIPAVIYFHGAGGSGARVFNNRAMTDKITERGYLLIAPNAIPRPGGRFGPVWSFIPGRPAHRDEPAFVEQVLADAEQRFAIDRDRVLVTGFSIGGSLSWYLACQQPHIATAYAPVAGAFWRPYPERCSASVKLLHTHGWVDKTVPLEGRPLGDGSIMQGDVFHALAMLRERNDCQQLRADKFTFEGKYWRRRWDHCAPNTALELVLHPGGHGIPAGWAEMALDWFEALAANP